MNMNINAMLNDDCLIAVLSHLSFGALFEALLVCKQWSRLRDPVCRAKRSLTMFVPRCTPPVLNPLPEGYVHADLYPAGHTVQYVAKQFPNLTTFKCNNIQLPGLDVSQMCGLLRSLPKLESVVLTQVYPFEPLSTEDWNEILATIATSLPRLRKLLIGVTGWAGREDTLPTCSLPANFPTTLEKFECALRLDNVQQVSEYMTGWSALRRLNLLEPLDHPLANVNTIQRYQVSRQVSIPSRVAQRLTHFNYDVPFENSPYAKPSNFLSANFHSLVELKLVSYLPLELLLTRYDLHKLESLEHLFVDCRHQLHLNRRRSAELPDGYLPPPITTAATNRPSVVFAKLTLLQFFQMPHGDFRWMEDTFPALKRIQVRENPRAVAAYQCSCHRVQDDFTCAIAQRFDMDFSILTGFKQTPKFEFYRNNVKSFPID